MYTLILQSFIDVKIELVLEGLVRTPFVKLKKKSSNIQIEQLRSVPRNTSHLEVESARQSPPKNKHQELWLLTKLWKRRKKSARLSPTLGNAEPVVTSERRFRRSCEEGREFGTQFVPCICLAEGGENRKRTRTMAQLVVVKREKERRGTPLATCVLLYSI